MAKRNKEQTVTAEQFCRAWTKAEGLTEVVEKTGLTALAARGRAYHYRKIGVDLKKFPRKGVPRLDIDALRKVVAEASK